MSTSAIFYVDNRIHFDSFSQPIKKQLLTWIIEGNLSFSVDLKLNDDPPNGLNVNQYNVEIEKEWHTISEAGLIPSAAALGILLTPAIEKIALSLLIVAL